MKVNESKMQEYREYFEEYFSRYYRDYREVKSVSYRDLKGYKNEISGYTAELEYSSFTQFVSVRYNEEMPFHVSACFRFKLDPGSFVCHFDDILDYYDSDDLSFYTYTHCMDKQKLYDALDNIMQATRKYFDKICHAARSNEICREIFDSTFGEDYEDELSPDYDMDSYIDSVDFNDDYNYSVYELNFTQKELKRNLSRLARKNKLKSKFEKRAYRVLSAESNEQLKEREKKREATHTYSPKDKKLVGALAIAFMLAFACIIAVIGYKLDASMFSEWIGKNHFDSFAAFFLIGMFVGLLLLAIIPTKAFKPFMSEKRFDSFSDYIESEKTSKPVRVIVTVVALVICFFSFYCGSFCGIGFSEDGKLLYKEYALSQVQEYSIEETEVAIVKGYYSKGYHSYNDIAYAFKIDDVWVDYGIADDDAARIIKKGTENREIKTYKSIGDID